MKNNEELPKDAFENWIGDRFYGGDRQCESVSMKPMISKLFAEAYRIAVIDCIPDIDDKRKCELYADLYKLTTEEWASIDIMALKQNIICRFIGTGGWSVRGVHGANSSAREVYEHTMPFDERNEADDFMNQLRDSLNSDPPAE